MEIAFGGDNFIKIRGKHASLVINPTDKAISCNGVLLIGNPTGVKFPDDVIVINGPGEYEVGGIKISGIRSEDETVYYVTVDDVLILTGTLTALQKTQSKLTESHVVLVQGNEEKDASFITGFTPNVVLFYGEKGEEVMKTFAKEGSQKANKYQVTLDKLPAELTTILLN